MPERGTRALLAGAAVLAALVTLPACGEKDKGASSTTPAKSGNAASPPTRPCGSRTNAPSTYRHVVWIWLEDVAYESIVGNTAEAPFINRLVSRCGLATNYRALANDSLPNYIAATSGGTQGLDENCEPTECSTGATSIFSQTGWRFYAESMPSNCLKKDADPYTAHHNPPLYYSHLKQCASRDLPLRSEINARFTFAIPNDSHSSEDSLAPGDRWLKGYVSELLRTSAYRSGQTAIFITWDEDDGKHGEHVPLLVVSPFTRPSTRSAAPLDHYSLLRTTEQMLGLPCLGRACSARSLRSAFGL